MVSGLLNQYENRQNADPLDIGQVKPVFDNRLLAVSEQKKSGLILCKAYHAEFAGPGALVGAPIEQGCTQVIAIGSPEIVEVKTPEERQKAYGRRIQWIRWLQKITDHPDPVQRAEKLLSGFEAFFDHQIVASLPDDALGLLVGVLPSTIGAMRSQYRHPEYSEACETSAKTEVTVLYFAPHELQAVSLASTPFTVSANFLEALYKLPYPA